MNIANRTFEKQSKWRDRVPVPVCDSFPEFEALSRKAWELARAHIVDLPGMPRSPYMDEGFCNTDIWIWDSCFMSLFCKYAYKDFPGCETLENFYAPLYDGVALPEITADNPPEWTGLKHGEQAKLSIHVFDNPPLFAWAEYENALFSGDANRIRRLLLEKQYLQKHFFQLETCRPLLRSAAVRHEAYWQRQKRGLGYFWEGGRSGMDNTPRGRTGLHALAPRPNNPDMLWIDAIAQQGLTALSIAKLAKIIGEEALAAEWTKRHKRLSDILNEYYWSEEDGCYFDLSATGKGLYHVLTPASFWPLVAEMAPMERAVRMALLLDDPRKLGGSVPLVSLSRDDPDFNAENGMYWRGSLWLPIAYAALAGLQKYGMHERVRDLSIAILRHMSTTYERYEPHTIWECYNPSRPEPARSCDENNRIVRPDFCGWSALGPISMLLENVVGFYCADAFHSILKWHVAPNTKGRLGVRNYRFGDIITDLIYEDGQCRIRSNRKYTLQLNGKSHAIATGENLLLMTAPEKLLQPIEFTAS